MKSPALSGASFLLFCPVWRLRGLFWLREALYSLGCGSNVRLGDLGRLLRRLAEVVVCRIRGGEHRLHRGDCVVLAARCVLRDLVEQRHEVLLPLRDTA